MPFARLVNKTSYKFSVVLPLRNPFGKFFTLAVFTHGELLSMLEGAPATHPLYHRGPRQARMKLRSNHKTCADELLELLTFDQFLVRTDIEDKQAVGFTEHRLYLVDADVAIFGSLVFDQGNFPVNGDYALALPKTKKLYTPFLTAGIWSIRVKSDPGR